MMKKIFFAIALMLIPSLAFANNTGTQRSAEYIANRVWNTTTNTVEATITGDATLDDLEVTGEIDWSGGNVIYVPLTGDIETYITNATAGDTLLLASGTYTITDDIDVAKSVNIVGNGTTIACATASKNVFHLTASNIRLAGMTITNTGTTSVCINIDGTGGTVLSGIILENLVITNTAANLTMGQCILVQDANGTMRNIVTSSTATGEGYINAIQFSKLATAEADVSWNLYNVEGNSTGITTAICSGLGVVAAGGAAGNIFVTAYDSIFTSSGGTTNKNAVYMTAATSTIDLYGCTLNGDNSDATQTAGTITLYDTTLVNGTTSGTITVGGYITNISEATLTVGGVVGRIKVISGDSVCYIPVYAGS